MTVKEIVIKYLKENGYDGICNEGCGCDIDNLVPCSELNENCEAGYRMLCEDPECEYIHEGCEGTCIRTKPEKQ